MVKPPRKIKFSREGLILTLFTFPLGLAAINTGNNMLYLILGMLLSLIALNGILSESTVKKLSLSVKLREEAVVGIPFLVFIEIKNCKRYFPSYLLRAKPIWRWVKDSKEKIDSLRRFL